jgi:PIN domain nuclease of toxin-antitoxin system
MPLSYLLDTQVLLWWFSQSLRLKPDVRAAIADPQTRIFVSAASFWEAAIKRAKGRLSFDSAALVGAVVGSGLQQLAITSAHALAAGDLPRHHDDPFDRMLVAQAIAENLTLISSDARLRSYPVALIEA